MKEDQKEKKREAARLRKRKQREREKAHREACGEREFRFTIFAGTAGIIDTLCKQNDMEPAELITRMIHGIAECDPSRLQELLKA